MSTKERIFQMVLFEVVALVILVGAAMLFIEKEVFTVTGLAIALSVIAMLWNYAYNLGFDKVFGGDRITRSLKMRIAHGAGFELGMIAVSFPVIMWALKLGFLAVLILDIAVVLFFFVYAIVFHWVYDVVRHNLIVQP
ncbi:MAG: PACE efflux transporter [Pseudomonadales bacterium]